MRSTFTALVFVAAWALPSFSQHTHQGHSEYADQEQSHIPSLTVDEFRQLEAGGGMGMAKPAELNHYPGPKHVLELADSLGLTEDQRSRVEEIRQRMAARAVELGQEYLHAEHQLNELFSSGSATETLVEEGASKVAKIGAALRSAHLMAHVETADVLSSEQIARYDRLRGYPPAE